MNKYGIVLVGTSVNPLVISIYNLMKNETQKIYLLATKDDYGKKGTEEFADRAIEIFAEKNTHIKFKKVLVDRSNIAKINQIVDENIILEIDKEEKCKIYVDYTGGTKVQSAFIREYFSSLKSSNIDISEIYINGDKKQVNEDGFDKMPFKMLDGANSKETIKIISEIKDYEFNDNEHLIKSRKTNFEFLFDDIDIEDYSMKFKKTMKNDIKKKKSNGKNTYEGKGKAKLELFEIISNAEKIGEEFCKITVITPKGKSKLFEEVLVKEILGIKSYEYSERLSFEE